MVKQPRILYFIDGPTPTPQQTIEANALRGKGAIVSFRNARYAGTDGGGAEACDGIAGNAPEQYKGVTGVDEAVNKYNDELKSESDKLVAIQEKTGASDNFGTHTLPTAASTPVAAAVRAAEMPGTIYPPEAPKPDPQFATTVGVENMGAKANPAGQPYQPIQPAVEGGITPQAAVPTPVTPGAAGAPAAPGQPATFNPAAPPPVSGK